MIEAMPIDRDRPAAAKNQRDSAERGEAETDVRAAQDSIGIEQARLRNAQRAEARVRVRALLEVERVVDVVRTDLDEDRAEEREHERWPMNRRLENASAVPTSTGVTAAASVFGRAARSQGVICTVREAVRT